MIDILAEAPRVMVGAEVVGVVVKGGYGTRCGKYVAFPTRQSNVGTLFYLG